MTLKNFQLGLHIYLMMPHWFECLSMPTNSLRANFIMVFLQLLQSNCQSQPTNIGLRDRVRSFFVALGAAEMSAKGFGWPLITKWLHSSGSLKETRTEMVIEGQYNAWCKYSLFPWSPSGKKNRARNEHMSPLRVATLPSNKCWNGLLGVANVAASWTDSQCLLTYYILYTTSLRQANRTSKIHLLPWFVDIMWKITLQNCLSHWKGLLFIQPTCLSRGPLSSIQWG